uniref:pectinesterase n=1 Tax=Bionectria ochroleuca TaxID=29856 RepID=A0A0B7JKY2_BIOOC
MIYKTLLIALSLVTGTFGAARTSPPSGAIIVSKSGGDYKTIQEAVNAASASAAVIFIQPGTYEEQVLIESGAGALTIYGYTEGDQDYSKKEVILTHSLGADEAGSNDASGTLRAKNDGLKVYNINIENSRGKGTQAIALSAYGSEQGYYGCQFLGYQDTILTSKGNHYFHGCYIEGATDFIFGQDSIAWFENCTIGISAKGYITANGRDEASNPGCELGAVVNSAGWSTWGSTPTDNVYYGEIGNTGEGASGTRAGFSKKLDSAVSAGDILGSTSWADSSYIGGESPAGNQTATSAVGKSSTISRTATTVGTVTTRSTIAKPSAIATASNVITTNTCSNTKCDVATTLQTVTRHTSASEVQGDATSAASATSATPSASDTPGADDCSGTPDGFASLNGGTTGGVGGEVVTVSTQADLEKYAGEAAKYIIKVKGVITITPKGTEIKVSSDKTIVGIGNDAEINEGGFNLQNQRNVIFRNIKIGNTYVEGDDEGKTQDWDGIQMDNCTNIWIDHVHLEKGGDGLIDSRKDTTFLTVSWSILRNHNKAFGIGNACQKEIVIHSSVLDANYDPGWTDNVVAEMTIHHNFFDETKSETLPLTMLNTHISTTTISLGRLPTATTQEDIQR